MVTVVAFNDAFQPLSDSVDRFMQALTQLCLDSLQRSTVRVDMLGRTILLMSVGYVAFVGHIALHELVHGINQPSRCALGRDPEDGAHAPVETT
jgi:hypothetical protein